MMATQDLWTLRLIEKRYLSASHSPKEAFHLSFENVSGESFDHQCGDALALWPKNPPNAVEKIMTHFAIDKTEKVNDIPLQLLLEERYCITHLTQDFLSAVQQELSNEDKKKFEYYDNKNAFATASLVDIIDLFPSVKFKMEVLLPLLKTLKPRLYSIASASQFQPNRLDLAIVVVKYVNFRDKDRYGIASEYLCHRLPLHEKISAFIVRSKFKLPKDSARDIIMVGPGTGIAPFRSFLQERAVCAREGKAVGRHWLFFGEQHRALNFYYQSELEDWETSGHLTHLDLAFSRDKEYKIYVQDRMNERGQELWDWLNHGAYFYVCGNASHMAKDVEHALLTIIQQYGRIDNPEHFLKQLKKEARYQRDVY
ncbi:MAG: hypothetical protein LBB11_03560 [Puniceicoccales bacterium]|jgi:sulfite reductase (NADPH) flavoprotein alpha-component|nr:hypothetical protein [Puniceicoccales bacterium]